MKHPCDTPFECIDPPTGGQLWRLEDPGTSASARSRLEAHLEACHACRLVLRVDAAAREVAGRGSLDREPGTPAVSRGRPRTAWAPWLAGLPLAACLAAVLFLPPRPVDGGATTRGSESTRFLRPVEGEVLASPRPLLRWTPIAGASRYEIEIRDREGNSVWRGESGTPEIRVDGAPALRPGGAYRALLSVRPADLATPGGTSVAFRTGSFGQATLHRMRWAHPALQATSLIAAVLFVIALMHRWGTATIRP